MTLNRNIKLVFYYALTLAITSYSYGVIASPAALATKAFPTAKGANAAKTSTKLTNKNLDKPIKALRLIDLQGVKSHSNVIELSRLAAQEGKIPFSQLGSVQKNYNKLKNGDQILLKCIQSAACDIEKAHQIAGYSQLHNMLFLKYPHLSKTALDKKTGSLAEKMMDKYFANSKNGWKKVEGEIGVTGIDGLYVKKNKAGEVIDVLIAESKYNKSALRTNKAGGRQMSEDWISEKLNQLSKKHPDNKDYSQIISHVKNNNYRSRLWNLKLENNKLNITVTDVTKNGYITDLKGPYIYKINHNSSIDLKAPENSFQKRIVNHFNKIFDET